MMTIVIFCFQTLRDNIYLLIAVLVMVLIAAIVVGLKILISDYIWHMWQIWKMFYLTQFKQEFAFYNMTFSAKSKARWF